MPTTVTGLSARARGCITLLASIHFAEAMLGRVLDAVEQSAYRDHTIVMLGSDHPNCSPSRYSNLTGKTVVRHGLTDIVGRNNNPTPNTTQRMISPGKKVAAIQTADITIPELLKTLPDGYAAAHWGKWHLNGGVRVPTLFRGPGIASNTQCDLTMMGVDILPTVWEWAGGSPATLPAPMDGGSLVPAIAAISAGDAPPPIVRPGELVHYTPHYVLAPDKDQRPSLAIHDGDYKLVIEFEKTTFAESFSLFHLGHQIGENADRSETELAIRWRLWVRARDYLKQVNALFALPHPVNWPGADGMDDGDVVELRELLTLAFDGNSDPDQDGGMKMNSRALTLIPYYAWAHRGNEPMRVCLARRPAAAWPKPADTPAT